MEEIVNIMLNNGMGVACLIYFMYYNQTVMKEFTSQMSKMNEAILKIQTKLDDK